MEPDKTEWNERNHMGPGSERSPRPLGAVPLTALRRRGRRAGGAAAACSRLRPPARGRRWRTSIDDFLRFYLRTRTIRFRMIAINAAVLYSAEK